MITMFTIAYIVSPDVCLASGQWWSVLVGVISHMLPYVYALCSHEVSVEDEACDVLDQCPVKGPPSIHSPSRIRFFDVQD